MLAGWDGSRPPGPSGHSPPVLLVRESCDAFDQSQCCDCPVMRWVGAEVTFHPPTPVSDGPGADFIL